MALHLYINPIRSSVIGYHGASTTNAGQITRSGFLQSAGAGEWLGHGVYFWTTEETAWLWARRKYGRAAVVFQATVVLGYCLDLDDVPAFRQFLGDVYGELERSCAKDKKSMPANQGEYRYLDCEMYNLASLRTSPPTDSVARTFNDGKPVFPGSDLGQKTQRQICVRNPSCILHPVQIYEGKI